MNKTSAMKNASRSYPRLAKGLRGVAAHVDSDVLWRLFGRSSSDLNLCLTPGWNISNSQLACRSLPLIPHFLNILFLRLVCLVISLDFIGMQNEIGIFHCRPGQHPRARPGPAIWDYRTLVACDKIIKI
jgi:hypothetical protein